MFLTRAELKFNFRSELANDYSSKNHVYCVVCSITVAPLTNQFFILIILRSLHAPSLVTNFLDPFFTFVTPL